MDPSVKLNQLFIRETIENASGSIMTPAKIYQRKLCLSAFYLSDGLCRSLNGYFLSLTFDQLQVLDLTENGLRDAGMAHILSALVDQRELK